MVHRCFEHLLLSSGNFEGALFLTRIISSIDRFSIRHVSLLLLFGCSFDSPARKILLRPATFEWDLITSRAFTTLQKAASSRRTPKSRKLLGEKAVLICVNSCLALL